MSNYSHALGKIIDENFEGRQVALADKCQVAQALISKHRSGEYRPDLETLSKLCDALAPSQCATLAIAHLRDETPQTAKDLILIESLLPTHSPAVLHDKPKPPSALDRLDRRTRTAIECIAEEAVKSKEARDVLHSTARFLGCEF